MCENSEYTKCNRAKNNRLNCSHSLTPIEISLSQLFAGVDAQCANILNSTHITTMWKQHHLAEDISKWLHGFFPVSFLHVWFSLPSTCNGSSSNFVDYFSSYCRGIGEKKWSIVHDLYDIRFRHDSVTMSHPSGSRKSNRSGVKGTERQIDTHTHTLKRRCVLDIIYVLNVCI